MVPAIGPIDARIMLVGEAPGEQEVLRKEPFVGASGMLLNEMLHDAGILRSQCFITNVARFRPPGNEISEWIATSKSKIGPGHVALRDKYVLSPIAEGFEQLCQEIEKVSPNIIVAFGNVSMWALTGHWGILKWRGSLLSTVPFNGSLSKSRKVLPAYHPAYILRDYSQRYITTHDLRKAARESKSPTVNAPEYFHLVRPNYPKVSAYLTNLLTDLQTAPATISVDIETRGGHIACVGLATSSVKAICIPFMCVEDDSGYWEFEQELAIIRMLKQVLTHPNVRVIGQNFIYDTQYFLRHWGFAPRFARDTMLAHHVCWPGLQKGLDFLSSMYCQHHVYWKDEGKNWEPKMGEEQLWTYNCKDAVVTFEADEAIQHQVDKLGLREQHDFQQAMFWPVLQAMSRGVRVDHTQKARLKQELEAGLAKRELWFKSILGHELNPRSPKQLKQLFYDDLKQKEVYNRKTGTITLNSEALEKIGAREPLLRPLTKAIAEHRSLGVFVSTFIDARVDHDGRMRCSYNIAGTETMRLSSSENAFGSGLNLQNVPKGDEDEGLPNVRKLFLPDDGFEFFDGDLSKADAQVVAWEADDVELKQLFRGGFDLHAENAKILGVSYDLAKRWVHATNYGGKARTMAISCGITVHEAEQMRTRWFAAHPGIAQWQSRTERELRLRRYITNRFGYRRYYFDRVDDLLPEALAWIAQSTVAVYINKIWHRVYVELPEVQVLLQVHDSLAGQLPTQDSARWKQSLLDIAASTVIPYADPLVIPFKVKSSPKSWGDCA